MPGAGATCRACALEWEHCHGTLVEQPDGGLLCSDEVLCRLPPTAHEHVEPLEEGAPRRGAAQDH